jgi:ketosteroid isomerase-like protein
MRSRTLQTAVLPVLLTAACAAKSEPAANPAPDSPAAGAATDAATDTAAIGRAIDSTYETLSAALRRGDTAGVAAAVKSVYAPDAIVMWNDQNPWRGREAFWKGAAAALAQGGVSVKEAKNHRDDLAVSGDLAVENGTYVNTLVTKAGQEIQQRGNYLVVWRRQPDGTWKVVREIGNDAPPAKP